MEWDKFWAENKKVLEDRAHRYMSVHKDTHVEFTVTNLPDEEVIVQVPIHPQKPEMGTRVGRRSNKLLLDAEDVELFKEGTEVTLLRWGNFFVDSIRRSAEGKILSVTGRANPEATNFSKTTKVSWLAGVPDLLPCTVVEFDHLISKAKIIDEEDFKDFVNKDSKREFQILCDPCVRFVKAGEVISPVTHYVLTVTHYVLICHSPGHPARATRVFPLRRGLHWQVRYSCTAHSTCLVVLGLMTF